ncbi:MAG: amidohydrolase, partial [[Clostridium] symbiosum]
VAKGAAMMAGKTVECELAMAFTEYIPNMALASVADECMQEIGAPDWTDEDYRLAREFLNTYNEQTKTMIRKEIIDKYGEDRLEEILENPLDSEIHSFDPSKIKLEAGSTDVGDVGYAVPTLNINVATCCIGNVGHTWQMTAQSCSPIAHKGLLTAAQVMALASVRTMARPAVIEAAKTEVKKRNGGKYTCPLPDSVKPPLDTY